MPRVWLSLCCAGIAVIQALPIVAQQTSAPLVIAKQGSFFVGGHDVHSETLSTTPASPPPSFAPDGTVTVEQMYVRYQVPVDAKPVPITLIHGCCLTGKTWETTPDGRMGWDEYFVRHGYGVYIIDQVSRGRSAANITVINSVKLGKTPPKQLPVLFAAGHEQAWKIFRFGPEYPKPYPGVQFPLEAIAEFWKQMVPDWKDSLPTPNPTVQALSELASFLAGTVLISHSESGIYPFEAAAEPSTKGIAGIIAIEPGECPDPKANVKPYTKMPILVLWGDNVDRSPWWKPKLKHCKEFAEAVNKAGGRVTNISLPEVGMHGNTHMLMQDKNNLEVADWLLAWINRNLGG